MQGKALQIFSILAEAFLARCAAFCPAGFPIRRGAANVCGIAIGGKNKNILGCRVSEKRGAHCGGGFLGQCGTKIRSGFSLVECILAIALFSFAAFVISQTCYNCLYPLSMPDKDVLIETEIQMGIQAILDVKEYDSLDDGLEVKALDGSTFRVYGEAIPTAVADLFELKVRIEGDGFEDFSESVLVIRPEWYENSNDRETLVDDRKDLLEDERRANFDKMREDRLEDSGEIDYSKKF